MRTIISFLLAIFIHFFLFYYLYSKSNNTVIVPPHKIETIDLTQFNFNKKISTNSVSPSTKHSDRANLPIAANNISENNANLPLNKDQKNTNEVGAATFIAFNEPAYPRLARARGIEGRVKVRVFFDGNGNCQKVDLLESSHELLLDEAVKKAALSWKTSIGNTVLEKTFEFKLNN